MVLKKARMLAIALAMTFAGTTTGIAHADKYGDRDHEEAAQAREKADPIEEATGIAPLDEEREVVMEEDVDPDQLLSSIRQENAALIQSARFAAEQAQDEQLRQYAQQVASVAAQANRRVDDLAERLDVDLATPEPEILSENVRETLVLAEGPDFDQVFLDVAIFTSQSAIQRLDELSGEVDNPELQELVTDLRNDIEQLQDEARRLQANLMQR